MGACVRACVRACVHACVCVCVCDTPLPLSACVCYKDEYGAKDYRKVVQLKADHASRPLWVVSVHAHSVPCVSTQLI